MRLSRGAARAWWYVAPTVVLVAILGTSDIDPSHAGHDVTITERDADRQITLAKGSTVTVRLQAALGTGYSWQIAENDPALLQPSGPPVIEHAKDDRPGAAEHQIFRFTAGRAGSTRLVFRYSRPWERDQPPEKTLQVSVAIK